MVKALGRIQHINANGILKMRKNVFAFQQSLPSVITFRNEQYFDRVRNYYDLIRLSPEDLLNYLQALASKKNLEFSEDEYLQLAGSLCIWQEQLSSSGRIDNIALQKLRKDISELIRYK